MSNILLYTEPMDDAIKDYVRVSSEKVEHTDYSTSDISTFVNDYFVFYVPPPTFRMQNRPHSYGGFEYRSYGYVVANLSVIQLFSYENGATVQVEWMNATVLNGTTFDSDNDEWILYDHGRVTWMDMLPGLKNTKREFKLDEYDTVEIQLNDWLVWKDYRIISGVVKITSDLPISVMHHKLYPLGAMDDNGYDMINDNWNGIFSAYAKKLFVRITGDCWISALEADTTVHVWDYSDKNDDVTLHLDRFEGWDYTRNAIFEQYGFDDDLVLISADKPVSIVAGLQSDQGFTQVFGKDGRDFHFPCFGKILIHAPNGAKIDLEDNSGNQGSYDGYLDPGEMRVFDFKVAYKQRRYSSFEWAQILSSEPILVYTFANSQWYLDENWNGMMSGEEYFTTYKKITELYPQGYVPHPADTEFEIPLRSRTYITIVNLDNDNNDINVDFESLTLPYKGKLDSYQSLTFDFSEDSYYPLDLVNDQTGTKEPSKWLFVDPYRRYELDYLPSIVIHRDDPNLFTQKMERENITKGSTVKIKADHPVLVMVNYNKDEIYSPQGVDLIPGLSPPIIRSLPDFPAILVIIAGVIIAIDMLMIVVGRRSIAEVYKKK
jgi:hypothetical protein